MKYGMYLFEIFYQFIADKFLIFYKTEKVNSLHFWFFRVERVSVVLGRFGRNRQGVYNNNEKNINNL